MGHKLVINKSIHKKWFWDFMDNCHRLNRSQHTLVNYRADLEKFIFWYESQYNQKLNKATGETITQYKEFLTNGGTVYKKENKIKELFFRITKNPSINQALYTQTPLAVASRKRHLSSVKNFFEFLKQSNEDRNNWFKNNPVKNKIHAIKLKDIDVIPTICLRPADFQKCEYRAFKVRDRLILYLLYYAGLRIEELTNLRVKNFKPNDMAIEFTRKGGKIHYLRPLNGKKIFKEFELYTKDSSMDYLFTNKRGSPLGVRSMYARVMKMLLKANCQKGLTPHSFRKGCATFLYIKNKDLLFVRDYLNHQDAKVTQTYIDKAVLDDFNRVNL